MIKLDIDGIDLELHREYFREPILNALEWLASASHPEEMIVLERTFGAGVMEPWSPSSEIGNPTSKLYLKFLYDELSSMQFPMMVEDMLELIRKDQAFRVTHGWNRLDQLRVHTRTPSEMIACQKCLRRLFSYKTFSSSLGLEWCAVRHELTAVDMPENSKWGAFEFTEALCRANRLSFCPYCNVETVYAMRTDDDGGRIRADIDHFFPHWKYPYLALCICNLVPSCTRCNSRLKRDEDVVQHRHPKRRKRTYAENLELTGCPVLSLSNPYCDSLHYSTRFEIEDVSLELLLGSERVGMPNLDCFVTPNEVGWRCEESVKRFRLQSVYRHIYGREIKDMPARIGISMSDYPEMLSNVIKKLGGLQNAPGHKQPDSNFIRRLLLNGSLCADDINNERLGKLRIDIYEQLCGLSGETHW